jgi:hypothetical protein
MNARNGWDGRWHFRPRVSATAFSVSIPNRPIVRTNKMKSLNPSEAIGLFSRWKERRSPLWVLFHWKDEADSFGSVIKDVGDTRFTLGREGREDIQLELLPGTRFEEGVPSEAPIEHRGETISKFEHVVVITFPSSAGSATLVIFEVKAQ